MTEPALLETNPCDPVWQQLRQDLLDQLYHQSGRDDKNHPQHATYTGLWMEATHDPERQP